MSFDFRVEDHGGSIALLRPLTPAAHEWVAEHIPADAPCLGDAVAVELRYVSDVVSGLVADGLTFDAQEM